jgi:hypothetical protein
LAAVTLDQFTVTPASTQAGSHPDVTIFQHVTPSAADDDVRDTFVRLAPGLLGNPQSATLCTREQLHSDAGCPATSKVGTVHVTATIHLAPPLISLADQPIDGTVYNLRPNNVLEPARLGIKLQPLALPPPLPQALPPVYLEAPAFLRPGADGIGLETVFADQPREQSGLNIQITSVQLTFLGNASRGTFMRLPTSCGPATSVGRVNSYQMPTFSEKTSVFTPTGCDALGFAPTAEGELGSASTTRKGSLPPLTTTLKFDPEEAALETAEVTLPPSVSPNLKVLPAACPRAEADANACPESSRVGTAIIDSPLQARPVQGPVYLAYNSDAALPGLIVKLPPPVALRVDGVITLTPGGVRNTFAGNPDLPLRSFTLRFDGGASGPIELSKDLCAPGTDTRISVKLTAHSGKVSEFKHELATPACDPIAAVSVKKRKRSFTLAAVLTAARRGPDLTSVRVGLPKALKRGRLRARLLIDGKKSKAARSRRAVSPQLGGGARRVKIVWKGLKRVKGKKLARTVVVPIAMTDKRGNVTTLRVRVRRG